MKKVKPCKKCGGRYQNLLGQCTLCGLFGAIEAGQTPNVLVGGEQTTGWPRYSESAGVLPKQVEKAKALDKKLGVPTDYTKDGRVIFRSRGHQKRWLKARHWRNNDGGYGD